MRENGHYAEYDFFRREPARPKKVWIETPTRVSLIKEGLEVAGSMNNLGRMLGYRSRRHPGWSVRQILWGFQPFPIERLEKLADITDTTVDEILECRTDPRYISKQQVNKALRSNELWAYVIK